jgi:hypothetical protein
VERGTAKPDWKCRLLRWQQSYRHGTGECFRDCRDDCGCIFTLEWDSYHPRELHRGHELFRWNHLSHNYCREVAGERVSPPLATVRFAYALLSLLEHGEQCSERHSAVAGSRNGATSEVVDCSPASSRVSVSTVMSSSWPNAIAASVACCADGRDANNACSRSKP